MQHHRPYWIQAAVVLLALALSGCVRSASTAMTPLPSAPPPTATDVLPETTLSSTEQPATATPVSEPTETPFPTETPQIETATATKASLVTEVSCGSALPSRLRTGSYAYVNPDPPLPNNLRSAAGENNTLVGEIPAGHGMKILDGPKCVDGSLWWQVSPLNTDLTGWTAEGDAQNYWLIPCASENECGT
jgi:hypothetical protein